MPQVVKTTIMKCPFKVVIQSGIKFKENEKRGEAQVQSLLPYDVRMLWI